jgi:Uma2 family endonuclease
MEEAAMERAMESSATKLTYDDYVLFPDDGKRHELIDGEHYMSPAPHARHQRVLVRLIYAFEGFLRDRRLGEILCAPTDVVFTRFDVVQPDLLYVSAARQGIVDAYVGGAPDLAVEILSPSNRRYDEVTKRDLYERTGVPEYWLVDPEVETVKVFRRDGDRFARPLLLSLHEGDVLTTPLLPGFELALAELFA